MTVEEFLVRYSGRATFEKMWKPLLLAKLGENYRRVSAVFIWTYVKRLFSARDAAAQKEPLGYVSGGYRTVFTRLLERIARGRRRRAPRRRGRGRAPAAGGGIEVAAGGATEAFDKVIFTGPGQRAARGRRSRARAGAARRATSSTSASSAWRSSRRKPFCPYYVLNIADERIPFTGVIGMSSLVDTAETAGLHLTYLPKYVLSDDADAAAPGRGAGGRVHGGLPPHVPGLPGIARSPACTSTGAVKVQPLQVIGYSGLVQPPRTRHPDFYVVNTAQFASNTLNNNEVIRSVNAFLEQFEPEFRSAA